MVSSFSVSVFFYLLSFLFVFHFDDWFFVWLGLELNMVSFIVISFSRFEAKVVESCFSYFLVQSLGSGLLLASLYLSEGVWLSSVVLVYSLGGGPFFFWFLEVVNGLSWFSNVLLLSVQSVLPLYLLIFMMDIIIWVFVFMSLFFGVVGSFGQISLSMLMGFSSVHHLGWLMASLFVDDFLWIMYLFMYSVMMVSVMMYFKMECVFSLEVCGLVKNKFVFIFLSLGGVPPFLGFVIKWLSFYYFLEYDYYLLMLMLIFSVCMLYVYLRFIYVIILGDVFSGSWEVSSFYSFGFLEMVNFFGVFGVFLFLD